MSNVLHQYGCKILNRFYLLFIFLMTLILKHFIWCIGNVYCTNSVSNPTPVYVVQGSDAVLQCGFDSILDWYVYNGSSVDIITSGADVVDNSKYLTSKKPSTGLYYKLHILNVGVSDIKKHRC